MAVRKKKSTRQKISRKKSSGPANTTARASTIAKRLEFGKPLYICRKHDYATDPRDPKESQEHGKELHHRLRHGPNAIATGNTQKRKYTKRASLRSALENGNENNENDDISQSRVPGMPTFQKLRRAMLGQAAKAKQTAVQDAFLWCLNGLDAVLGSGRRSRNPV